MTGKLLLGLMLVSVGGCVPLAQAPLVYSSRQQMGVGVSAGTPDTPGLDLTLGYKGLDAAYIPVAVGRACQLPTNASEQRRDRTTPVCDDNDLRIYLVTATNNVSGERRSDPGLIANLTRQIEVLEARGQKLAERKKQLELARQRLAEIAQIDAPLPLAAPGAPPQPVIDNTARRANLVTQVDQLTGIQQPTDSQIVAALNATDADISGQEVSLAAAQKEREQLRTAQAQRSRDDKVDALSVYGSFEGNAKAGSTSAGLTLGKVFSTGVAAQNLTQGLQIGAAVSAGALCLEKLAKLTEGMDGNQKKDTLTKGLEICATGIRAN